MKKRRLTPTEVEKLFDAVREREGFSAEGESAVVKAIVETAKRNGTHGDKVIVVVAPYQVHIPRWQRMADLLRANSIGANYNSCKWDLPKVICLNGKLVCCDGMHRLLGALLAEKKDVVVEYLEITEMEAIDIFLNQTKAKNAMKPMDYYNASIVAGKPDYVAFKEVCHKHNVQIKGNDELPNPIGVFTSISDGVRMDKKTLDKILNLINKLRWNGSDSETGATKVYGAKVIRSVQKLYAYYSDNEAQMERVLMQHCKGTEWFKENLADMPQYYIFDLLNKVVSDSMAKSNFMDRNVRKIG